MRVRHRAGVAGAISLVVALGLVAACEREPEPYESWYPADISPPPGTRYPCEMKALPAGLPGIPRKDHRFVDHALSLCLRATHAKLVLIEALASGAGLRAAHEAYRSEIESALAKLRAEPVPDDDLAAIRTDLARALELQLAFFDRAAAERADSGRPLGWSYENVREGRAASQLLLSVHEKFSRRYQGWPAATADAFYHHLCALDLF